MSFFNDAQLSRIRQFYDNLIESFGVSCKLIYHSKFIASTSNLQLADSTYISNTGLHGGPIGSTSHEKGGQNLIAEESSEDIIMVVDWTIKDKKIFGKNINLPHAIIKTRGFLEDLPKLQKCVEMQINLPNQPITVGSYRILGEGDDIFSISKNRYFFCYWERIS
jgi:hypothetical protein